MKNKMLIFLLSCLLVIPIVLGATTQCQYTTYTNISNFTGVNEITYNALYPYGPNVTFNAFTEITPKTTFIKQINETLTMNVTGGYVSLTYRDLDNNSVALWNGTDLIDPSNYTIDNTTVTSPISYVLTTVDPIWEDQEVVISYNVTFTAGTTNIYGADAYDICGTGCVLIDTNNTADYNVLMGWNVISDLNNTDWQATWTYTNRTCQLTAATKGCQNSQTTIFAGLGLIAVITIVLAAFAILGLAKGEASFGTITLTTIGIVGLGIVVMIGYYIISQVGYSICIGL
jgi:hypothetical protein